VLKDDPRFNKLSCNTLRAAGRTCAALLLPLLLLPLQRAAGFTAWCSAPCTPPVHHPGHTSAADSSITLLAS
jgi:hypothetical protein